MLITIYQKPAYVHGLSLQDAIFRACRPEASDREIVLGRQNIALATAGQSHAGADVILAEIRGAYNEPLAASVYEALKRTVNAFLPRGRRCPALRVRFAQ